MYLPSPGTLVAEKYQLEALLGEGGMGAVYRARHVLMDKPVALKWLRPELCANAEARERLIREARSVARVRHPNVVQVFDVDSYQGSLFMVMELLEGETFADLIAHRRLSTQRIIQLLTGALYGLAAAHDRGIIHRDVKPENIFIVQDADHPEGVAKLLDFGISKADATVAGSPRLTQTGLSIGTPLYMSVEQLTRTDDVDLRSDIYSFGVLLYHALSGSLPFDGETFAGVVLSIATTEPLSLKRLRPDLPAALDRVVMRAMARKRDDRYANAYELIAALRSVDGPFEHPSPPIAYEATRTPGAPADASLGLGLDDPLAELLRSQKALARRRLAIAVGVVLALAAVSFGWSRAVRTGSSPQVGVAAPPSPPHLPTSVPPFAPPVSPPLGQEPPQKPSYPGVPPGRGQARELRAKSPARAQSTGARVPATDSAGAAKARPNLSAARPEPTAPTVTSAPSAAPNTVRPLPSGKSGGLLREDF